MTCMTLPYWADNATDTVHVGGNKDIHIYMCVYSQYVVYYGIQLQTEHQKSIN